MSEPDFDEWTEGSFKIIVRDGYRTVPGLIRSSFGIHRDAGRKPPGWVVTHIPTGHIIWGRPPFAGLETAKVYVDRILPLIDWNDIDPNNPPLGGLKTQSIAEELLLSEGTILWRRGL